MADNTDQFNWIVVIKEGLEALFAADPDVFVAGDLLWYPTPDDNKIRTAPDAMVAFGCPKGYRGSYMQWVEGGTPPQVVFEVMSPSNTQAEMREKAAWYGRYGVEEFYIYDLKRKTFRALVRSVMTGSLEAVPLPSGGYVSPRLRVRFDLSSGDLINYRPNGEPFKTNAVLFGERDAAIAERDAAIAERDAAIAERDAAIAERDAAIAERDAAIAERDAAIAERDAAAKRASVADSRADAERAAKERLAAKLRALGIDPDTV